MQRLLIATFFALLVGCAGGGCSSGCSCGGVTPLPGGFPIEERIENVAAVRITDSGLDFLSQNVGNLATLFLPEDPGTPPGIIRFNIPETSGTALGFINYTICPGGANQDSVPPRCVAEVDLGGSQLTVASASPHEITVTGPVKLRVQELTTDTTVGNPTITVNKSGQCPGTGAEFAEVPIGISVSIEIESNPASARNGYSIVKIGEVELVAPADGQPDLDDQIFFCDSFLDWLFELVDSLLVDTLVGGLTDSLLPTLEEQLCQPADPTLDPACPVGSFNVDGICRVGPTAEDDCVSVILGLEGNIDLAGLLASISPGTKGGFDFVLAAGGASTRPDGSGHHFGDLNPIAGGATLSFYGGATPTPLSNCVTPVAVDKPTNIPVPEELNGNTVPGWPGELEGPHFGFALSERFTNYLLTQTYNSGALCIGITAEALGPSVPLTTALIGTGLGAPSLQELGWQKRPQPLAIVLRPSNPPVIEFGGGTDPVSDPNVLLTLEGTSFDFYVWSLDRYIRAFTTTLDIVAPVTLEVTPDGLSPAIPELSVSNATVTNSVLLREDPAAIAASLQDLLGSLVGSALGDALPPIDINALTADLGLGLQIPPSTPGQGSPGLTKLTAGSDDFLGIFATLELTADPMGMMRERVETSQTSVEVASFEHDEESIRLDGWTDDNQPSARLYLGSNLDDGTRGVEWQVKVDRGFWRPFTRDRQVTVTDPLLRLEGKHVVKVRSRVIGQPETLDPNPVEIELIVDSQAPNISISEKVEGEVAIDVDDLVSGVEGTTVRLRYFMDGDWTEWSAPVTADRLQPILPPLEAEEIEVEATDEDGNVGVATHALIRGRADGGGCACRIDAGPPADEPLAWPLFALLGAVVLGRRRRRHEASAKKDEGNPLSSGKAVLAATVLTLVSGASGCSCGDDDAIAPSIECRNSGTCTPLQPGLVGAYTSADVADDGTVWVSGYLEADWGEDWTWGDLAVGRMVEGEVQWQVVDGLPTDQLVDVTRYDQLGFRNGYTDPGPDVGLWTSLAINPAGNPSVAYYDATNQALKFAVLDGFTWNVQTVQQVTNGNVGRYAKLIYVGGTPTIAYNFVEPGDGSAILSGVRVASFNGSGWSFEDVLVNDATPCRAELCPSGTECLASTLQCVDTASGCDDCGTQECVMVEGSAQCADVTASGATTTYPDATGLYVAAAVRPDNSLGLAFYDRTQGNLWIARQVDGQWSPLLIDGEDAEGNDTGDKGIGTSLFIDQNDNWHVTYVNGLDEALNYVQIEGAETVGPVETVDDGLSAGDGVHIVGGDSNVFVSPGGEVRVSYQDATAGSLRFAVGTPSADGHDWSATTLPQDEFAGAFSKILEVDGGLRVVNWWRTAAPSAQGNVRMVSP